MYNLTQVSTHLMAGEVWLFVLLMFAYMAMICWLFRNQ